MEAHIYRSHIGDVYWVDEKLEESELLCDICKGMDEYLGVATTIEDFIQIINSANARYSCLFANEIENAFENSLTVDNIGGKIFLSTTETKVE